MSVGLTLFTSLRSAGLPVSLREYLTLLEALAADLPERDIDRFYFLCRATLIKDERHLDQFDQVFATVFSGISSAAASEISADIPAEWLTKLAEKFLTPEERAEIAALGGFDTLMETLRRRLAEQTGRHQGGSKWIGTAGTSPFGAYGYNPEGIRIGQAESRHRRAVKVWDQREFRDLDGDRAIGTRTIQVALRRLRRLSRQGRALELDLDRTISGTARQGWLDLAFRPERRNALHLTVLFDIGGSMDDHVRICEDLFAAARSQFKAMDWYYFHNCPYERLWKDNRRRRSEPIPTLSVIHRLPAATRLVIVGDAAMSPYEIAVPGGSVEHWNEEPGAVWMQRIAAQFRHLVWLNPLPVEQWRYSQSVEMMRTLVGGRMYPLTLAGLDDAVRELMR